MTKYKYLTEDIKLKLRKASEHIYVNVEDLDSFKHTDEYSTPESFEKSFLRETCDGELNKEGLIRYFKQTNYQHFARIMQLAFGGTIVKENDMFFWVSEDGEKYNPKIFV